MPRYIFEKPALKGGAGLLSVTFDGFVVETSAVDPVQSIHLARRALRDAFGTDAGWIVKPMEGKANEVDVTPPSGLHVSTIGQAFDLARRLKATTLVETVEPCFDGPGLEAPPSLWAHAAKARGLGQAEDDESTQDRAWHLRSTRVLDAWALTDRRGAGIRIAHPDTGYTTHPEIWDLPELRIRHELGHDFVDGDSNPLDDLERAALFEFPGHGTSTASVIMSSVGLAGIGEGITGVAPDAEIVPYRVSRSVIHLGMKPLTRAIRLAMESKCHVVSMSLGGPFRSAALRRAIRDAVDEGIILLAAAGNVWPWVAYPAAYQEVIAVAATNQAGGLWQFSATGEAVDFAAPGVGVWAARARTEGYDVAPDSGTSYAVAIAAGVAALWLAKHGRDSLCDKLGRRNLASTFQQLAKSTACRPGSHWKPDRWGAGILDAKSLLEADLPGAAKQLVSERRAISSVDSPWAHYVPGRERSDVENTLDDLLRGSHELQPPETDPSGFGAELAAHLAVDPSVRGQFEGAKETKSSAGAATRNALTSALAIAGSQALRQAMGT